MAAQQAVEAAKSVEQSLSEIIDKIAEFTQAHAGDAVLLAGKVYQLSSIATMLHFVPWLIVFIVALLAIRKWGSSLAARTRGRLQNGRDFTDEAVMAVWGIVILTIATVVSGLFLIVCSMNLLDPLLWAALFDPRVALAAHVLKML